MEKVAVLGAGTMATGIAAAVAAHGIDTTIWARSPERAQNAQREAGDAVRTLTQVGLATQTARVDTAPSLDRAVQNADFVIEAISEDVLAKRALFSGVESYASDTCVLASTTSGLSIDELSADAVHPERFVVAHFWNPAHLIPLVEVLGGTATDPQVVAATSELLKRIDKHPVVLHRFVPGFLGVRLQQAVVREAIALLDAGVASAADIDTATRLSFGARFPVIGPLETSDLGGLDVVCRIHEYLLADLDASPSPQPPLRKLVEAGDLGVKSGRGFYDWSERDAAELIRRRDEELIERLRRLRADFVVPTDD